jgi:hypothetical protein
MLIAMALMATVLKSTIGVLTIVAGLWLVALVRARAARTTVAAREFLIDILAMALVLVVPLIHAVSSSSPMTGMVGMRGASLGGITSAAFVVLGWAGVRLAILGAPALRGHRAGSLVSGSCCAAGLLAMLVI